MGFSHIGQIIKHKGLSGHVVLKLSFGIEINHKEITSVFIDLGNNKVPFMIDLMSKIKDNHYLLKFIDLNNREETNETINKDVFIDEIDDNLNKSELSKVIDYEIFENNKVIGTVINFLEKNQPIIFCEIDKKEVLIPFVDKIIESVDHLNKRIYVKIPKGLLDLN